MAETPETRDALPPQLRAISDALDEWLSRKHGIISSWQSPQWFLKWLEEKGWTVVDCKQLEATEKALAACKPVGAEFCNWCWHNPPHDDGCPIAATEKG